MKRSGCVFKSAWYRYQPPRILVRQTRYIVSVIPDQRNRKYRDSFARAYRISVRLPREVPKGSAMRLFGLSALVLTIASPTRVLAWGDEAHEIIVTIASALLTPAVKKKVNARRATDKDTLSPRTSLAGQMPPREPATGKLPWPRGSSASRCSSLDFGRRSRHSRRRIPLIRETKPSERARLVEAAGIEPASASPTQSGLHA